MLGNQNVCFPRKVWIGYPRRSPCSATNRRNIVQKPSSFAFNRKDSSHAISRRFSACSFSTRSSTCCSRFTSKESDRVITEYQECGTFPSRCEVFVNVRALHSSRAKIKQKQFALYID